MDKIFIDTNLLCYYFDDAETEKQSKSQKIINDLVSEKRAVISTQSLQEFSNVAIKKLKLQESVVESIIDAFSSTFSVYQNSIKTIKHALQIKGKTGFSFYDSLILASANECACSILYSEDLSDGQIVENVKIENPL